MGKNSNRPWVVGVALLALTAPIVNAQRDAASNNPPLASPVTGKALHYSYGCYACHGYNGETGARPFVGRWGHLATEQDFVTFLRGRANVAPVVPSTSMPNFSADSLPDRRAKDIYAYIRTFKSSAPELKDIPTLNAIVDAAKQEKK
jgi:mono/diheme cytochrome c family protein